MKPMQSSEPTHFCLNCGYGLLTSMATTACPECGRDFDLSEPKSTSRSPKWFIRFWYRRSFATRVAALCVVVLMPLFIGIMEYRHSAVRDIESYRITSFGWSWNANESKFYDHCVELEYELWGYGEIGYWAGINIERIRRRLRSNFSSIDYVDIDTWYIQHIFESDEMYSYLVRSIHLGANRGALALIVNDTAQFHLCTKMDGEVGERSRAVLELANRYELEIKEWDWDDWYEPL